MYRHMTMAQAHSDRRMSEPIHEVTVNGNMSACEKHGTVTRIRQMAGKNDPNIPPIEGSGLRWKIAGGGSPWKVGEPPLPRIAASSSWECAALNDSKDTDAADACVSRSNARARANAPPSAHEQKQSTLDRAHETEAGSGSKRVGADVVDRKANKPKQPTGVAEIRAWPGDASELLVGGNDTWNLFQSANKGRSVSTDEWKASRAKLLAEQDGVVEREACVVSMDLTGLEDTDNREDHPQDHGAAGGKRILHQNGHTHESRLSCQAPAMSERAMQRYVGRASGKTLTSEMTREGRQMVNELKLSGQLQDQHQATAPQDDGEDEIEDWAQCERCKKWRKLGVCAAPNTKSGSVTESIPAAEVVGISEFDLSSSNFVCKMAGDVTCDMPEDMSWVLLPAFDLYEETPTLKLCLSALEQLTFKIPEKGYLRKVGIDMQGSMLQEIRKTPAQVHEVGNLLKRVVSFIDKRFMKNRWMMQWQQGWEEAIDEATCADTVYDAGIKIEKSGIDWNQLQILRKETQGKATGRISAASFDTSSAPPSSAAGCRSRVSPQTALAMTKSKEGQAQIHDMIDDMFGGYVAGGVTEMREKEEVAAKKQREEQAAATARSDGETLEGGTSSMSSGGKARRNKKLEKEAFNWARKFERLKRFQIKHGHVQVKKSSPDDQVPPN
jgi:hypothetical protein